MEEARPRNVKPPAHGEPTLCVGIIINEDNRSSVSLLLPAEPLYVLSVGDDKISLPAQAKLSFSLVNEKMQIESEDGQISLSCSQKVSIKAKSESKLSPGSGIVVNDVVAGRSFHWRKTLSVSLPGTIFVQPSKCGQKVILTNELGFETYLACVIASEMNAFCPPAFIRAQATAARSWAQVFLSNKHTDEDFDVCNDDDCQRYQGTTHLNEQALAALEECRGLFIVTSEGDVCPAYYSKCCGGHQELAENVFGFPVPGISAGSDSAGEEEAAFCSPNHLPKEKLAQFLGKVDVPLEYFQWHYEVEAETIIKSLREKFALEDVKKIVGLTLGERGISWRLKNLTITYLNDKGVTREYLLSDQYDIRRALHDKFLFSSAFDCETEREEDGAIKRLSLTGRGWGHGVGLCQMGALAMALEGMDHWAILQHYYPQTTLERVYQ